MTDLFELLEKVVGAEGEEVEITLPEEKVNHLSLEIIKKEAERRGKKLKLRPSGPRGKRLIALLEEGVETEPVRIIRGGRFGIPRLHLELAALRRVSLIPFLLFGIFLLLGGGAYWGINYFPRAEVTLTLQPIPMVKDIPVLADTEATEINKDKGTIPGTKLTVEEEGQKSTPATGKATVGEKAKGTVTFTSTIGQHCSSGARLKDDAGVLIFVLDAPMDLVTLVPQDKTVTAEKIGSNYNLAAGKTFHFLDGCANISAVAGQNPTTAFTGGESHEVKIVSSADQAKVLDELKKELVEKGKTDLGGKVSLGQIVIQEAIKEEVVEQNFLQKVGEQADEVNLTLKMKFTTIAYKEEDLRELVSQVLGALVPENYELFPGEMGIETREPKLEEKTLSFAAKVTAQVIPKIDLEAIKKELSGRDVTSAQEYLASLSNVTAYELRLWPNLPKNLRRIPRSMERIRIKLQTEEEE